MRNIDFLTSFSFLGRAVVVTDPGHPDNPIQFVNPAYLELTGYTEDELIGRNCRMLQGPQTDPLTVEEIRRAVAAGVSIRRVILNYRKDGTPFWNDLTIDPVRDAEGQVICYVGIHQESLEHGTDEKQVLEARLSRLIETVPGFVFQRRVAPDGTQSFPYVSPSLARIVGLPPGTPVSAEVLLRHLHPEDHEAFYRIPDPAQDEQAPSEFRLLAPQRVERWFRCSASPQPWADGSVLWEGVAIEIDHQKEAESRASYLANHDELTGLANRARFKSALVTAISTLQADAQPIALFTIDLDNFQAINDASGQAFGDKVLRRLGMRMVELLRGQSCLVARLGGDEFAVLAPALPLHGALPDADASDASGDQTAQHQTDAALGDEAPGHAKVEASARAFADALRQDLERPLLIDGEHAAVTASVGVAVFPALTASSQMAAAEDWAAEVMKRAQVALQAAKHGENGPGQCQVYGPAIDDRVKHHAVLRHALGSAVVQDQLELHYHPLVDLGTGAIVGAEALLRWRHPTLGLQRPELFLPLAESSGLVVPIGAWVVQEAMRHSRAWEREGIAPPRIAINVSVQQLQRSDFVATVERALDETGVDPSRFEFELTESAMNEAPSEVRGQLVRLRALGFGLSIDDFGTGRSSFTYLRDFPVDTIKIDQTFVRQLVVDSNDASIIRAMIALARSLDLGVTAEGVETEMQRDFLYAEGCRVGQGFLFGRPLPAWEFGRLLAMPAMERTE